MPLSGENLIKMVPQYYCWQLTMFRIQSATPLPPFQAPPILLIVLSSLPQSSEISKTQKMDFLGRQSSQPTQALGMQSEKRGSYELPKRSYRRSSQPIRFSTLLSQIQRCLLLAET